MLVVGMLSVCCDHGVTERSKDSAGLCNSLRRAVIVAADSIARLGRVVPACAMAGCVPGSLGRDHYHR